MSYIESIVPKDNSVAVKCQYDQEYKMISSNQCSWCSYEFVSNLKSLITNFKKEEFQDIYNKCLLDGSTKRKECNKYKCGENIDDEDILKSYQVTIVERYKTVLNKEQADICELLDPELRDTFFKRDNVIELELVKLKQRLDNLFFGQFLIINRYGQSFAILGVEKNQVMIVDSHCRVCGIVDCDKALKYITSITPDNSDGYNLILWMFGYI